MVVNNILEQLQSLLNRLQYDDTQVLPCDVVWEDDPDYIDEDECCGLMDDYDDSPQQPPQATIGLFSGYGFCQGILPILSNDEEDQWIDQYEALNRKSKRELILMINQLRQDVKNGITIDEDYLRQFMRTKFVCPCRELPTITINSRNELYVQADEVVIPLSPQMRALYLLFLLNPAGIRITNLALYRRQFTEIYRIVTNRSDFHRAVSNLFDDSDPNHRNFHSLRSNINRVISRRFVDEEMIQTFKIAYTGNGLYRVKLPADRFIIPQHHKWQTALRL